MIIFDTTFSPTYKEIKKVASSHIGYTENHDVNLPNNTGIGSIAHELVHALGLHHEHVRSDRDNFVHVRDGLIKSGRVK